MSSLDPIRDTSGQGPGPLVRDIVRILLTGIALGVAFNALGLASRPPRGLPWIGASVRLEPVVTQRPQAKPTVPGASVPPGGQVVAAPEKSAAHPPKDSNRSGDIPARSSPSPAAAGARGSDIAAKASGADPPAGPPPTQAALPVIPESERPRTVDLPLVTQFVEAGAALVVDARESAEFADGHIPGAVSIPYDDAVRDPAPLARLDPRGRPIIVYCSGGSCEASRMLADMLVRDFHQRRVLVYEGGYPEWVAAGRPVTVGTQ
jgi:rhodanese-related sulfurtransferase